MEILIKFLLQSSIGISIFYVVYWIFLKKETFHKTNRYFMLSALFLSITIPLMPISYPVFVASVSNSALFSETSKVFSEVPAINSTEEASSLINWWLITFITYITGATIFLSRLMGQTVILMQLIVKSKTKNIENAKLVENDRYGLPFSFFNIIFINPKFHKQEGLPEILAHETVHIREKHWVDLIIIELLTVIFWFNPFIWFFEHSIKQNHEYLADNGVISRGHNLGRYQALLINQLMGMQIIGFTNNLNFALNTNRLKMMTKQKTPKKRVIKLAWILPAIAILLIAFAKPSYRERNIDQDQSGISLREFVEKDVIKISGYILDEEGTPLPGASVIIKGTTKGTVANKTGLFKLETPKSGYVVFSFVGKTTLVVDINEFTKGNIKDGVYYEKIVLKNNVVSLNIDKMLKQTPPPPPKAEVVTVAPDPPSPKEKVEIVVPASPPSKKGNEKTFYIVESMPVYPGGEKALAEYVLKRSQKIAKIKDIKGKAKIGFTVGANGKVSNINVIDKDNDKAAKAAYGIISNMETWKPGKQRGKSVPVNYTLPIEFN